MDPFSVVGALILIVVIMLVLKFWMESIEVVFFVLLFFLLAVYFLGISYANVMTLVEKVILLVL